MRANSVRDGVRLVPRLSLLFVLVSLLTVAATGAQVPVGKPDDVGLSAERLQRIGEMIERAIDAELNGWPRSLQDLASWHFPAFFDALSVCSESRSRRSSSAMGRPVTEPRSSARLRATTT